ncbi:hypothetical protein [Photobacterium kasasachensis]|uniref:hypothetical protein n=1 Tax=Photobacterium kasasachensis TaxID=2910240 RepID=UPI003D0AA218
MDKVLKIIVCLLLVCVSFGSYSSTKNEVMRLGFREKTTPLTLSTGEVVQIEGMAKIYVTGSEDWVLMLNYRANSLDPKELQRKAELIWPKFKPIVERMGLKYASIHAKKYPIANPDKDTMFLSVNLMLYKGVDNVWRFMNDAE